MHFYAVCYKKGRGLDLYKEDHKDYYHLPSVWEYNMDAVDHKELSSIPQHLPLSAHTYSIHTYGNVGKTPGLASLFEEGPTIFVGEDKEPGGKGELAY